MCERVSIDTLFGVRLKELGGYSVEGLFLEVKMESLVDTQECCE